MLPWRGDHSPLNRSDMSASSTAAGRQAPLSAWRRNTRPSAAGAMAHYQSERITTDGRLIMSSPHQQQQDSHAGARPERDGSTSASTSTSGGGRPPSLAAAAPAAPPITPQQLEQLVSILRDSGKARCLRHRPPVWQPLAPACLVHRRVGMLDAHVLVLEA